MLVRITALLGVLLALSGCSAAARTETGFPDGKSVHTMTFGGLDRSYPTSHALNATQTIWQFFAAHPA